MSSHGTHERHQQLEFGDAGGRAVQRARPRGGIRRQKAHRASAGQVHGRCRSTLLYRGSHRAGTRPGQDRRRPAAATARARPRWSAGRPSSRSWILPPATRTRGGWSMMRAIRLCRRANATRRCTTRRVTSATAPTANDADGAVTVRPMIAPMATATAKSNAPSWASVRRSPSRRPMTATANIRTALTATQPRPPVSPTSSSNRFTPCAYRQPECLPGQICVQAPRSPSGRNPQNCYICAGTPLYSHRSAVIRRASRASHSTPRSPVSDNGTS